VVALIKSKGEKLGSLIDEFQFVRPVKTQDLKCPYGGIFTITKTNRN